MSLPQLRLLSEAARRKTAADAVVLMNAVHAAVGGAWSKEGQQAFKRYRAQLTKQAEQ